MRIAWMDVLGIKNNAVGTNQLRREKILEWVGVAVLIILAAGLRFSNLSALGYANHYYTAAVKGMLQSWPNFFFVAAEPGGSVSVDKPPLGLWIQAASAAVFGVNGFGVLFPELLAGVLSVVLVYYLVKRSFGVPAGLLAGLVLAVTPVVVATDRNNTMDSLLIFTLLLATWAFIKATESAKMRYLLLGAFLVGLGFNIKMLEAFLPLPAFFACYFLGAPEKIGRKLLKLGAATVLLVVVSLSWAVAVDLTPAENRPYVGSSGNNTVLNLIVGYNGVNRLMGMGANRNFQVGAPVTGGNPMLQPGNPNSGSRPQVNGGNMPRSGNNFNDGSSRPGWNNNNNGGPQMPNNGGMMRQPGNGGGPGGGFGGGGFPGTGRAGVLRLFTQPLSKEVSWMLPFALFCMALLLFGTRLKWPLALNHRMLVLWGGWLLTGATFFSVAGFFHEYYLSMLAAPLAALVGVGCIQLWQMGKNRFWPAALLLLAAGAGTLAFQMYTAAQFIQDVYWMNWVWVLFGLGAALLLAAVIRDWRSAAARPALAQAGPETLSEDGHKPWQFWPWLSSIAFSCIMAALLITPGIWSGLTNQYASGNQSLPSAYENNSRGPGQRADLQVNQALLQYLEANTDADSYLMAVPSSMQGADYVISTGRPVLYMGGFSGQDQVLDSDKLQSLVSSGKLRFIYEGGGGRGGRMDSQNSSWINEHCSLVQGFDTTTRNSGAPDGTAFSPNNNNNGAPGTPGVMGQEMQVSLYDCAPAN
ncbi:MAG: glycosyltransferase family 39 protein [Anaerolineae bacterium]|nr:glycosyltransferase family 39 protein [Anaerolineae bacterium]